MKLTKNELRVQQNRLQLLHKYLPTLQLKKAMLQAEVSLARLEIDGLVEERASAKEKTDAFSSVLTDPLSFDITLAVSLQDIKKRYENLAGVEVPYFEG